MSKNLLSLLLLILLVSCSKSVVYKSERIKGKYLQKEQKWIELHFNDNNFVLLDTSREEHLSTTDCCDTISYGGWEIDKYGLIKLTTPEELNNYYLDIEVSENRAYSRDSLYFIVENPIEDYYKKTNRKEKYIQYKIDIGSNITSFDQSIHNKRYSTNVFSIAKVDNLNIYSFEITVIVDPEIRLKYLNTMLVNTLSYDVQSKESNVFRIKIPDLSFNYLSCKRLNGDYLKIVNTNKLIWDGQEYIKIEK